MVGGLFLILESYPLECLNQSFYMQSLSKAHVGSWRDPDSQLPRQAAHTSL